MGWCCFHVRMVWLSRRHNCVMRWLDCELKEMGSYVSKTFHTKFTNFASLNFLYVQRFHLHLLHLWGRNSYMLAHILFLVSSFYVEFLFLWTMLPTHVFVVGQKDSYENGGDTWAFLDGNNGPQQQHGLSGCNSFSLTSVNFSFLQVVFQDSHSFSWKLFLKLLHFFL